jgi:hypothetical protein
VWVALTRDECRLLAVRVTGDPRIPPRERVRLEADELLRVLLREWPWGPWRGWDARELARRLKAVRRTVEARLVRLEMMDREDLAA